jgi:hypothetical protein
MKYFPMLLIGFFYAVFSVANPHSVKSETLMQELDMRLDRCRII